MRRQFGREQRSELTNLGDAKQPPVFSEFRVDDAVSGRHYRAAIRGAAIGDNLCTCPDFATNDLGTCKHIEFTLARLAARRGGKTAHELRVDDRALAFAAQVRDTECRRQALAAAYPQGPADRGLAKRTRLLGRPAGPPPRSDARFCRSSASRLQMSRTPAAASGPQVPRAIFCHAGLRARRFRRSRPQSGRRARGQAGPTAGPTGAAAGAR